MSDQTLTPLRMKKNKPVETTPKRRFSFSFADTSASKQSMKLDSTKTGSPQFARLLSPKTWRLSRVKQTERHTHDSTNSLPDRIQQSKHLSVADTAGLTTLDSSKLYTLRVYASDLHPDILYKTITVTVATTAVEALQLLLNKYAVDEDDKDHNRFNLAEVNETNKGSYFRTLKDNECPLQVQQKWVKANEWSFWLMRKEMSDSPTFEFRPSRNKELEIPIDVSYLNRKYTILTVPISDENTCAEVVKKVLDKFKLSEEKCDDYCLWEMMGDGKQMTGVPLFNNEKVLTNKQMILSGESTLFLRPQGSNDSRCASPADLDRVFVDSNNPPYAWISNTQSQSQGDDEEITSLPWISSKICDETSSVVTSVTPQHTSGHQQIVHSFSEPFQLSGSSSKSDAVDTDLQFGKPVIKITTGSTGTSSDCSTESIAESQTNSMASETLQTSNSSDSSTTEVDVVQEAKSPCLSNPVRVCIRYPCILYQDSNYLPPKKLSSMIEEMIKDGMPRLMRKIVAETKLAHKNPANIFNFDLLPQEDDAAPSHTNADAVNEDFGKPVGSAIETEMPEVAKPAYTLTDPPKKCNNVCHTLSSDSTKSSDGETEKAFSDTSGNDQHTLSKQESVTLPRKVTDLIQSNRLQRSYSLMSERRRMQILRNMSQSVKDRLRRHSSSAATSSTPSSLDICPASPNSSTMSSTPTESLNGSPTRYSVNVLISNTVKKPLQSQTVNEPGVPAPKNKVRRWISFNYGDKTKSKAAQKYMKHLEKKENH